MACAAAVVGVIILAVWFNKSWPGTHWTVLSRDQVIANGHQISKLFGVDTSDWKPYVTATVSKSLVHDKTGVSPLSMRVTYAARQGGQTAEVGFDSAGTPVYWGAPGHYKPPGDAGSSEQARAATAFRTLAGSEASAYEAPVPSAGDDVNEREYVWRRSSSSGSGLKDRIKVSTKGGLITSAERSVFVASDQDEDSEADEGQGYDAAISGVFGVLSTAGILSIFSIYLLWIARKAVSHRFPIRVAIVALVLMVIAMVFGSDWQKSHSLSRHDDLPIIPVVVTALVILCFVTVGRAISVAQRPKWFSMEQLCLLAPVSKSTGQSIAAGVLFGPLLAALPFLIAGSGLFPHASVPAQSAALLYSNAPLWDCLRISATLSLIGFFGFALPAFERALHARWLRFTFAAPVGAVFFAGTAHAISDSLLGTLAVGLLTLILFWYVWAHFDLLSVLVLQRCGALVAACWIIGQHQKGGAFWSLIATLCCLLAVGLWLTERGQPVAEGDPLANSPALTGFRAEREKLQAEFSLARRAQQDMLPPTPKIAGYSLAASCAPSLEVGGDLYDFLRLTDGRIGIGVADVSGKGVPAALYMTLTKGLLASVTKDSAELIPVVEEVNRLLHSVTRKKVFVTMALGFLDMEKRLLQFVRAGHNPIVWRQTARAETTLITPGGLGLGITAGRVFTTQLKMSEMALSEGDAVVFYSDGITEAMNSDLELFGEERLMQAVERADRLDAAGALDSILSEVRAFLDGIHPQDDMTMVVLRVGASEKLNADGIEVRGLSIGG